MKLCKDCIYCSDPWTAVTPAESTWRCTHKSSRRCQPISPLTGEPSGQPFFLCEHVRGEDADILADRLHDDTLAACGEEGRHYEEAV